MLYDVKTSYFGKKCTRYARSKHADDKEAESAKATATEAGEDLKRALKAFDHNRNCTASNKTTPRRQVSKLALGYLSVDTAIVDDVLRFDAPAPLPKEEEEDKEEGKEEGLGDNLEEEDRDYMSSVDPNEYL
ncbi:hypothetical protein B0A54_17604 [Friedmanniomyces endolithicus]|uniref:Uncharacterized protein n=1 Tax=Friedmanniomyces endolithicus TaxID=329885 RepID=A0A4U0TSQ9_9PEZI|nr:hypothetical protein B0A54_17604 [Friedmanniomyces endolithicus]